jgi:hypothetical protein
MKSSKKALEGATMQSDDDSRNLVQIGMRSRGFPAGKKSAPWIDVTNFVPRSLRQIAK